MISGFLGTADSLGSRCRRWDASGAYRPTFLLSRLAAGRTLAVVGFLDLSLWFGHFVGSLHKSIFVGTEPLTLPLARDRVKIVVCTHSVEWHWPRSILPRLTAWSVVWLPLMGLWEPVCSALPHDCVAVVRGASGGVAAGSGVMWRVAAVGFLLAVCRIRVWFLIRLVVSISRVPNQKGR